MSDKIEKEKVRHKISEFRYKACVGSGGNNATLEWCADQLEEMLENE